jgi:hypothetical protein
VVHLIAMTMLRREILEGRECSTRTTKSFRKGVLWADRLTSKTMFKINFRSTKL